MMLRRPADLRPARPAALGLEIVQSEAQLARLGHEWEPLLGRARRGAPFRSHAWLHTWWLHFGQPDIRRELFILLARDETGALRGILPLYRERGPLGLRRLALLGSGQVGSDYLGPVVSAADEPSLAPLFAGVLRAELAEGHADLCDLSDLDAHGPLPAALLPLGPGPVVGCVRRRWPCPSAGPIGDFDAYLEARPGGAGAQLLRRLRWLEARPGVAFERLTTPTEIAGAFPDFLALHRERWAAEGGGDGIATPELAVFHREAAHALARRGQAELYFLRAQGARRAALYGFAQGGVFYFYQSGHERAWRPRSVGTVLLGLVLRDVFARGLELDFGHGEEPYKLVWATGAHATTWLRLHRRYGRGHLLAELDRGRRLAGRAMRGARALLERRVARRGAA